MIWDRLTTVELDAVPRRTPIVLPLAATEQHGPHLPLATDRLITEHFASRLDARLAERVLILPAIAVGCSDHHRSFVGTLSVRHATMLAVIEDQLASVAAHGFADMVLLNGHGGNAAVAQVALESFGSRHPECRVVATSWWRLAGDALLAISETGPGGVGHACELETSILMHVAPELVRSDRIEARRNRPTFPWAEADMLRSSPASLYRDIREMTLGSGVFGEPAAATADKGRAIEEAVVDALEGMITTLAPQPGG